MNRTNNHGEGGASRRKPIGFKELSMLSGLSVSTLRRRYADGSIHGRQYGGKGKKIVFDANDWEAAIPLDESPAQALDRTTPPTVVEPVESKAAWMRSPHYVGE